MNYFSVSFTVLHDIIPTHHFSVPLFRIGIYTSNRRPIRLYVMVKLNEFQAYIFCFVAFVKIKDSPGATCTGLPFVKIKDNQN
jgi:hypothetical protein